MARSAVKAWLPSLTLLMVLLKYPDKIHDTAAQNRDKYDYERQFSSQK